MEKYWIIKQIRRGAESMLVLCPLWAMPVLLLAGGRARAPRSGAK